jgi:hypothetical protein
MSPPSLGMKSKPSNKLALSTQETELPYLLLIMEWILGSDVDNKKYINLIRELLEKLRMKWGCLIKLKNLRGRYYEVK